MWGKIKFLIAKTALRLAMWLEPVVVHNAMAQTLLNDMRREGVIGIEFGFTENGAPAMLVKRISDLPVVTMHQ